jgi:MFS family permease
MGIWSVLTFLLFYLESVLGLGQAAATRLLPMLLGGGACLAVPASLIGAAMADRFGLVRVVQIASWVMAGATGAYVLIALHPAVWLIAPAIIVFSIGNGAYGAVDWLLALRVLPSGQSAGKDFGIWHACMVAPQIIGPLSTGLLISAIRSVASASLAYEAAFALGALWFVLGAALVGRVRIPVAS